MIVATTTGSRWLYSRNINGLETFSISYSRADLSWGTVTYTPGDFDGDGKPDLAITGSFGTYWYYSTEIRGSFFVEELRRGAVQYLDWRGRLEDPLFDQRSPLTASRLTVEHRWGNCSKAARR